MNLYMMTLIAIPLLSSVISFALSRKKGIFNTDAMIDRSLRLSFAVLGVLMAISTAGMIYLYYAIFFTAKQTINW